jgi:hypothetical protein
MTVIGEYDDAADMNRDDGHGTGCADDYAGGGRQHRD